MLSVVFFQNNLQQLLDAFAAVNGFPSMRPLQAKYATAVKQQAITSSCSRMKKQLNSSQSMIMIKTMDSSSKEQLGATELRAGEK